jgi:hypothetical protein
MNTAALIAMFLGLITSLLGLWYCDRQDLKSMIQKKDQKIADQDLIIQREIKRQCNEARIRQFFNGEAK